MFCIVQPAPLARPAFRHGSMLPSLRPSRSQKRVLRRNAPLRRLRIAPWATEQQYDLFRSYLDARHAQGGMADMDIFEFAAMIEETPVTSRVMEYSRSVGELTGGVSDRYFR